MPEIGVASSPSRNNNRSIKIHRPVSAHQSSSKKIQITIFKKTMTFEIELPKLPNHKSANFESSKMMR